MRAEERIPTILEELEKIWKKYPDLRLGQLISNVVRDPMLYYAEDETLIAAMKKFYLGSDK